VPNWTARSYPKAQITQGAGSRPGQLAIGSARAAAHATAGTGKADHSLSLSLLPFDADDDARPGSLHTVGVALLAAGVGRVRYRDYATLTFVQKIALTVIVDQAHNSN
jgi:hypothetical protein